MPTKPEIKPETKTEKHAPQHRHADNSPVRDTDVAKRDNVKDGEHITQNKPTVEEGMAHTGPAATMDDVGRGSVTEDAPAVRNTVSDAASDRVVQQGDEVVVHGRALVDGLSEAHGLVLKVNQDSTIAVRIQRANGQTFDITGIHNADLGTGESWWSWPANEEIERDRSSKRA